MNDEIDAELDERLVTNLVNRAVDHEDERTIMSETYWKERAERLEEYLRGIWNTPPDFRPSRQGHNERKAWQIIDEMKAQAYEALAPKDATPRKLDGGYEMSIHSNPDHTAWARFFKETFPDCGVDEDTMAAWFANAMMAKHDSMVQERPTDTPQSEATEEVPECPECHVAADRPKCAFGLGGNCPRPRLYGRTKRTQQPQGEAGEESGDDHE